MADRRRTNAPAGGTCAPVFAFTLPNYEGAAPTRPTRSRNPDELRKIFLKTGLTPSASGSAYFELTNTPPSVAQAASSVAAKPSPTTSLAFSVGSLKLSCVVQGPKPLPRSSPFTPYLNLTTTLKFAPFAARQRRGYVRDAGERDLGQHLEAALRGIVLGERWPKSGVDVIITVLEGEEDGWAGDALGLDAGAAGSAGSVGAGWGMMNVLAGCITVASAAIVDAGIDCVDMVAGGVAALVRNPDGAEEIVLDPSPPEHEDLLAACVVGYLPGRDEITELWMKGDAGDRAEELVERSVQAALASRLVLDEAVKESAALKFPQISKQLSQVGGTDVEMAG